jgi:hypothetical protein
VTSEEVRKTYRRKSEAGAPSHYHAGALIRKFHAEEGGLEVRERAYRAIEVGLNQHRPALAIGILNAT